MKSSDGFYHIKGKKYEMLVGSRAQVWHGTAYKTDGGLKNDLMKNKRDHIVSKKTYHRKKRKTFRKSRLFYTKR